MPTMTATAQDASTLTAQDSHSLFGDIYREQHFYVLRRLQLMLCDRETASDLAQEVFYKVFTALEQGNREVLHVGYVVRMATNLCIDHLRQHKSRQVVSIDAELLPPAGAYESYNGWPQPDRDVLLQELLAALPASLREIAVYRLVDGFELDEIAALLHIPRRTLQRRLDRIRRRLLAVLRR
jgi:RNA polymerase sigma-70 factor, ECF subfamily